MYIPLHKHNRHKDRGGNLLKVRKHAKKATKKKGKTITVKKKGRRLKRKLELNIYPHFIRYIFNLVESTNDRNYYKWLKVKLIDIF